jgi:Tol biopolymer transport system component
MTCMGRPVVAVMCSLCAMVVSACSGGGEGASASGASHVLPAAPKTSGVATLPGKIVYAVGNGNDLRIFAANGDGSRRRLLVDMDPGLDMAPQVSPDGQRVVFRHNTSPVTDRSDIWLLDLRTALMRNLTRSAGARNWGPSWSPDGRWVVFNRGGGGVPELWVMRPDGSGRHRIAEGWAEYPRFSPDGRTIVFESRRDGNYEIYTVHPDGSALRRLTHTLQDEGDPSFSPDGHEIVFTSQRDSTKSSSSTGGGFETERQVYLMLPDGSHQHPLVRDRASDELPTFLPDGRILFFSIRLPAIRDTPGRFLGAFTADSTGQTLHRLSWPWTEIEVSWLARRPMLEQTAP